MQRLKNLYRLFVLVAALCAFTSPRMSAQELNITVEVNTQSIEGTNKSVFETLKESITEYFNTTQWTNTQFSPVERIEGRFFLTVKEYDNDVVKGELQLQLSRPVYNSVYTTTLFNFKDNKIEFSYREGEPLTFNETNWENNLLGILNFYAYLFLGIDFDTFSPKGGQPFFDKAAMIVQQGQASGEVGWKAFDDARNRSALLNVFTENNTSGFRDLLYQYHRKGLDEMATSPDKGRAAITESLAELEKIYNNVPMSVALTIFRDSKLDELVNIYSKSNQTERDKAFDILSKTYPTDTDRLKKIKNPDNN